MEASKAERMRSLGVERIGAAGRRLPFYRTRRADDAAADDARSRSELRVAAARSQKRRPSTLRWGVAAVICTHPN